MNTKRATLPEFTDYLRRTLDTIFVPKTVGKQKFSNMSGIFLESDLKDWVNFRVDLKSGSMPKCTGDIYSQTKKGTIMQVIKSFKIAPKLLCWTEGQVVAFTRSNLDFFGNLDSDPTIFFPLQGNLVAAIHRRRGQLVLAGYRFSSDEVFSVDDCISWFIKKPTH